MPVKTRAGRILSDVDLDRLAESAEAGFDVSTWRPRPGRPALSSTTTEHSPRIAVRLPEALRKQVASRAAAEGRTLSEVVRGLLEDYALGSAVTRRRARNSTRSTRARAGKPVRRT